MIVTNGVWSLRVEENGAWVLLGMMNAIGAEQVCILSLDDADRLLFALRDAVGSAAFNDEAQRAAAVDRKKHEDGTDG